MSNKTPFHSRFAAAQLIVSYLSASVQKLLVSPGESLDNMENTGNGNLERYSGPIPAAKRLRQLLSDPRRAVFAPGVYDGISARVALAQGFDCLYMVSNELSSL